MPVVNRVSMQPKLRDLYDYWGRLRRGEQIPSIIRLLPEDLEIWLPNIAILAVRREQGFVYRYYGQTFVEAFGIDMTGLDLERLPESQRQILKHEYDYVVRRKKPTWRVYSGEFFGNIETYERLILPFSKGDGQVSTLVVAAYEVKNEGIFDVG